MICAFESGLCSMLIAWRCASDLSFVAFRIFDICAGSPTFFETTLGSAATRRERESGSTRSRSSMRGTTPQNNLLTSTTLRCTYDTDALFALLDIFSGDAPNSFMDTTKALLEPPSWARTPVRLLMLQQSTRALSRNRDAPHSLSKMSSADRKAIFIPAGFTNGTKNPLPSFLHPATQFQDPHPGHAKQQLCQVISYFLGNITEGHLPSSGRPAFRAVSRVPTKDITHSPAICALKRFLETEFYANGAATLALGYLALPADFDQPQVGADPTEDANGVGVMQDVCAE
ncbi:hypothetical protein B0H13DRAFT_2650443 [Mycena leptocephala]|nr:hypothetical protein B0H13DRAFT_2650443 [Mycena leptocephala]